MLYYFYESLFQNISILFYIYISKYINYNYIKKYTIIKFSSFFQEILIHSSVFLYNAYRLIIQKYLITLLYNLIHLHVF